MASVHKYNFLIEDQIEKKLQYKLRRVGIYLHRNAIARNGPKVTFAAANVHKASNSVARNGVTSFNVYR